MCVIVCYEFMCMCIHVCIMCVKVYTCVCGCIFLVHVCVRMCTCMPVNIEIRNCHIMTIDTQHACQYMVHMYRDQRTACRSYFSSFPSTVCFSMITLRLDEAPFPAQSSCWPLYGA